MKTSRLAPNGLLWIFDFDDTLVVTDSKVWVTGHDGTRRGLTPSEFTRYQREEGDRLDYTDFDRLVNPRWIGTMEPILRHAHEVDGADSVVVLSARTKPDPIEEFLRSSGLHGVHVKALANADPHAKAIQVNAWIEERSLHTVRFFDDSVMNIDVVRKLGDRHPTVTIHVHHVG